MCQAWHIPTNAIDEVQWALITALVEADMDRVLGSYDLRMLIPFDREAGFTKMREDWLENLNDNDMELWKLLESYVSGGFGISLAWRAIRDRYIDYIDTPAWPIQDVVLYLMENGSYAIQSLNSYTSAWLRPGDEEIEDKLNTAGGVYPDSTKEAYEHYVRYARVLIAPFEIPDIAGPMEDIAALWTPSDTVRGQSYILENRLLDQLSTRYDRTVSARDLRQGLARPDSCIYRAFMRSRLNTTQQEIYQDHLWLNVFNRTANIQPFDGTRHASRMGDSSRSVIPVYVLNLLAASSNQVYMMTVAGPARQLPPRLRDCSPRAPRADTPAHSV